MARLFKIRGPPSRGTSKERGRLLSVWLSSADREQEGLTCKKGQWGSKQANEQKMGDGVRAEQICEPHTTSRALSLLFACKMETVLPRKWKHLLFVEMPTLTVVAMFLSKARISISASFNELNSRPFSDHYECNLTYFMSILAKIQSRNEGKLDLSSNLFLTKH